MGISFNSVPSKRQRIFYRRDADLPAEALAQAGTLRRRKVQSHSFYPRDYPWAPVNNLSGINKKELSETSAPSLRLRAFAVEIFHP